MKTDSLCAKALFLILAAPLFLSACGGSSGGGGDEDSGRRPSPRSPVEADGFILEYSQEHQGLMVVDYQGESSDIVTPSYIKYAGVMTPVVGLEHDCFYNRPKIKKVSLSPTVKYIGDNAFAKSGVSTLHVTGALAEVTDKAFADSKITISQKGSVEYLATADSNYGWAYTHYYSLPENFNLPSGCEGMRKGFLDEFKGTIGFPSTMKGFGGNIAYTKSNPSKADIPFKWTWYENPTSLSIYEPVMFLCEDLASLQTVTISNTSTISASCFSGCSKLTQINLSDSITTIEKNAFYNCAALQELNLSDNIVTLGSGAFQLCKGLRSIRFSSNLTTIPERCFAGCSSLTSIVIPEKVTSIGSNAFGACSTLVSITLPERLSSIGYGAFSDCTALRNITIPGAVRSIYGDDESKAFEEGFYGATHPLRNTPLMESVTFEDGNPYIIEDGIVYDRQMNVRYCLPTVTGEINLLPSTKAICGYAFENVKASSIVIPNSVQYIGAGAFKNAVNLTSITIPSTLKKIGSYAFENCTKLAQIDLPTSLTYLGTGAFSGCTSLASISLPSSLNNLGNECFKGCKNLAKVEFSDALTTIPERCFEDCEKLPDLTLPACLEKIGAEAFKGCLAMANFDIAAGNAKYEVRDGILYEKGDSPILALCPVGKKGTLNVNKDVLKVADFAFSGTQLTKVEFGCYSGRLVIGKKAFSGSVIEEVGFSGGNNFGAAIGEEAFSGVKTLRKVTGNINAVGKMAFANSGLSEPLYLRTLYHTSGSIWWTVTMDANAFQNCPVDHLNYNWVKSEWNECNCAKDLSWRNGSNISYVRCSDGDVTF